MYPEVPHGLYTPKEHPECEKSGFSSGTLCSAGERHQTADWETNSGAVIRCPRLPSQAGSVPRMVNLGFSSIKGGAGDFQTFIWSRIFALAYVYGHITLNTLVLVRSLKLSKVETC